MQVFDDFFQYDDNEWSNVRSCGRCAYYSVQHARDFLRIIGQPSTRIAFDQFKVDPKASIQPICEDLIKLVEINETDDDEKKNLIVKLEATHEKIKGNLPQKHWLSNFELARLLVLSNCDFALYFKSSENLLRLQWISNSDIRKTEKHDSANKFSLMDLYSW